MISATISTLCSRGGPMCPPGHTCINPWTTGGDRAPPLRRAKETNAQCRFEIYQATPNLCLSQTKTPGMTAGTKASISRPPSQRPPQPRTAKRPRPSFGKSPPGNLSWSARGYSFDWKRISSRKPPTFVGGSPPPQGAVHLAFDGRIKAPKCRQASLALPGQQTET